MARPTLLGLGRGWREKMMYFPKEKVLFCLGVVQTIVLCIWFYKGFVDWRSNAVTHSNIASIGKMSWASKTVLKFSFQLCFSPFGDCLGSHTFLLLLVICVQMVFIYLATVLTFYPLIGIKGIIPQICLKCFLFLNRLENVWK